MIHGPAMPSEIIQDTQSLIHNVLGLLGAEAEIEVIEPAEPSVGTYLFQLRLPTEQLPVVTGKVGNTWLILRALVRLAGAHHRLKFEIGLADPPGVTWKVGIPSKVLRVPVKMLRGS